MAYKKSRVVVCPICNSSKMAPWMGGEAGVQYLCKACGYVGPLAIEKQIEA